MSELTEQEIANGEIIGKLSEDLRGVRRVISNYGSVPADQISSVLVFPSSKKTEVIERINDVQEVDPDEPIVLLINFSQKDSAGNEINPPIKTNMQTKNALVSVLQTTFLPLLDDSLSTQLKSLIDSLNNSVNG